MKHVLIALVIAGCGTSAALAGPIEDRQQLMKNIQAATKDGVALARGIAPFDGAKAKTVLQVYIDGSAKIPALFPQGSETGSDTTADPRIWVDMAGFKAAAAKLGDDAKAAQAATDTASFGAAFGEVTKDCSACHGAYRTKKQ